MTGDPLCDHRSTMITQSNPPAVRGADPLARVPTAPLAAAGLIGGFGVAVSTGSRPLGGAVLAASGIACIGVSSRRDRRRTTVALTATGLVAFAASHPLGHAIGAWPAVLTVSAVTAALCWRLSDSQRPARR
jgi:hypothetical protein